LALLQPARVKMCKATTPLIDHLSSLIEGETISFIQIRTICGAKEKYIGILF